MTGGGGRRATGALGESIAAAHLESRGCDVIARNWRPPRGSHVRGEIDIVARCGARLLFVEVRTRHGAQFGEPEESFTPRKYAAMIAAVDAYLIHELSDAARDACDWRIDLIAVRLDAAGVVQRLAHIEGVGSL